MVTTEPNQWREKLVSAETVLQRIEPGMGIFLGTGVAEPQFLIQKLMEAEAPNLQDLELIQLVSLGSAVSLDTIKSHKYRLKTFFSGWVAGEAIATGRVDLIPSRFSGIPCLLGSGVITIDVAFVQVTPPDDAGYCSLGVAIDVARQAMDRATLVVGEINPQMPVTYGDTFVPVSDFDFLVETDHPLICFDRWQPDDVFDRVGENVAAVIEDGSCIGFSIGPLFEALSRHLVHRRNLGIHSPFFTDALMDLVKSGAVTNRSKTVWRGKSLASYAFGTETLMKWLHRNPLVEFQAIDKVCSPMQVGRNKRFISVLPARKVDLSGKIALHAGKGNVAAGPGEAADFVNGAEISPGGKAIFALPSRNLKGEANIRLSVDDFPNQLSMSQSVDMIVTEYGVANLAGQTIRERAQALIDIAHPEDRLALVEQAKKENIIYPDQIFLADSAHLYPADVATIHTFKNDTQIRFRAIRPSDEEQMRRLFYRFSEKTVYYRYFTAIKAMPHEKMQAYVNVDYRVAMSIVGLVGEPGQGRVVAEARYVKSRTRPYADVAFVVDGDFEGLGIATYMLSMLVKLAKERGILGFTADVLASNKGMMRVFEKSGLTVEARLDSGAYELSLPFTSEEP
ncbi:MAG: GNAT family N-acetyltransferase [Desulfobacterales bacterium]|nr:GNAT family N-acetyltransferase [Desulfobacterales bacterium]